MKWLFEREERKTVDKTEWATRAINCLAQGETGTNSKRRSQFPLNYPSHLVSGSKCYVTDAWGQIYTDFICGLGAMSLGYNDPDVTRAVTVQLAKGNSFSLPTTQEVETAELIQSLIPSAEKIRFLKTGNEASLAAIRIARAKTDRKLVLTDGYHGHGDIFTSLTPPALGVKDSFHIEPLEIGKINSDVACVIVEALKLDMSETYRQWLLDMRTACKRAGAIFIMDEIVTGFRVPDFTISNHWKIEPDMILLGKGMANGFELSAVCGKKEVMDAHEYFISSTFSGSAVALAACYATIQKMLNKLSLKDLMFYGKRLQEKLNSLHPQIRFEGWGTRSMLNVGTQETALFMQEMCRAGYLFGKATFFNFSHLDANIEDQVINIAGGICDQIKQDKFILEGDVPRETFKR